MALFKIKKKKSKSAEEPKRGPGRPRKYDDEGNPIKRGPKNTTKKVKRHAEEEPKRGPGRPRKYDDEGNPIKRGPGRPRKDESAPPKKVKKVKKVKKLRSANKGNGKAKKPAPTEVLIIRSKVKDYVKTLGFRTGGDYMEQLNVMVGRMIRMSTSRAEGNKRGTLRAVDA